MVGILAKIAGHVLAIPIGVIEIFAPSTFEGEYKKLASKATQDFSQAFSANQDGDDVRAELDAKSKATVYWQEQYKQRKNGGSK